MKLAPLWQEAAGAPAAPFPRGTVRADVAVVGGGLTGLSAAYHIAAGAPGARVVLLEAGAPGAGASGRSTGMLGPGVGQSFAGLVRRLGPARAAALYRQTLSAVTQAQALIEREGIDCELEMTGQLLWARSRGERRRLARLGALMQGLDLPCERLDDQALDRRVRLPRVPGDGDDGPAALRLPRAGLVHPGKLVAGLARRAATRGARLFGGARVTAVDGGRAGRPVRLAVEGGGEVIAGRAVIATAGYTHALGLLRGRVLPVHLQALATAPLSAEALAALGWRWREGVVEARRLFSYFRLTSDHRLVFGGAAPRYHFGGRPPPGDAEAALAALRPRLDEILRAPGMPAPAPPISHVWTGVIGYTLDALPCIGRDPRRPAVIHAVGWCGHGLALALASGAWVARLAGLPPDEPAPAAARPGALAGGADLADLAWFRATPPALPGEALRWLSFRAAVGALALLDRLA